MPNRLATLAAAARPINRAQLLATLRSSLWVAALFGAGLWLAHHYAGLLQTAAHDHGGLGMAAFFASSVVAVLMPLLTNLPLVPAASLAWGPMTTAVLLLAGWVVGAGLSFTLGRHARGFILGRLPSIRRHADIDRLVWPRHRVLSLVMLRMTFPVDVLSYALGLFSRDTTLAQNLVSTALGAAPFAVLFAAFPVLPPLAQVLVFGGSALVFFAYLGWMLRRTRA